MSNFKIYNGSRFLFVRPEKKPVLIERTPGELAVDVRKAETAEIKSPSVFSKYDTKIVVGSFQHFNPVNFNTLMMGAVVTDRKVYKPGDKIHLFAFVPQKPENKFTYTILKNDQDFLKEEGETDEKGVFTDTINGLEDGAYRVSMKFDDSPGIICTFTVARHTLSFMRASLVSHSYMEGEMPYSLSVIMGDIPYTGRLKAGLYCDYCRAVVLEQDMESTEGFAEGKFLLEGHTGPFSLVLTTPGGESATIFIPGTRSDVREIVRLSGMGEIIDGSLLPSEALTARNRGIYYGSTGTTTVPVILDEMVDEKAVLRVTSNLDHLVINIYSPISGTFQEIEQRNVKKGSVIELNPPHPLSVLSVGSIGKDCYETFSLLMKPEKMELEINAPEKGKPGQEIDITVTSNRSGKLMLIVADSRLERENPFDKLTEETFKNIRENLSMMKSGKVEEMPPPVTPGSRPFGGRLMMVGAGINTMDDFSPATMSFSMASSPGIPDLKVKSKAPAAPLQDMKVLTRGKSYAQPDIEEKLSTSRMDFPEVILAELSDFDERLTRKVKLGDQIGSFTIIAFLLDGMDYISESRQVEVSQDVYAELDVPALISPGDEIVGRVYARCPEKGSLKVLTSLTRIEKEVEKTGIFEITIKSAGEVMAELDTPQGRDTVGKTVGIPGREKIMSSRVVWLKPGETVTGEKIFVYPGVGYLLKDMVKPLVQYPFGCAEQTSAKLFGLALVHQAMKKKIISNGSNEAERLLYQGAGRMELFYDNGAFSLWEGGTPADYVTAKVLSNLRPLWKMGIHNIDEMISGSVEKLLKNGYKDNSLVCYGSGFAGTMKTIRDAVSFYQRDVEKGKAVALIKEKAVISENMAYWQDQSCWAGETEATSLALQVMNSEDPALFQKGFNYLSTKLRNGMLYSTSDTKALLELLNGMASPIADKALIDGKEQELNDIVVCREVSAIEETLVRIDEENEVDYLSPRSDFDGELNIERTSLKLGEKINLSITPKETCLAPLVRFYLPGNVASLKGGAGLQMLYLPIRDKVLNIEIYGVRKGKGKLRAVLHDMYDSEKVGVLPGLTINVS